ncbi:MAG: AAA family ATPase [candidate division Zixibacteria bacterium]|nr:AAA family ATPase [candidate division Zixibacteria bacterium]
MVYKDNNIILRFSNLTNTIIKEYKIKFLILDTLHRHANYDENSANDMNKLYITMFQKLLDERITVMFLHHTTKQGDFRGSSDFLGMCDLVYKIYRLKDSNKFRVINIKNRLGEIEQLAGEIEFEDNCITFSSRDVEEDKKEQIGKLKELTAQIQLYTSGGQSLQKKDMMVRLENDNFEFSSATLSRCLAYLVDIGKLQRNDSTREYSLFKTNGQAELAERGSQDLKSNAKNVMELAE